MSKLLYRVGDFLFLLAVTVFISSPVILIIAYWGEELRKANIPQCTAVLSELKDFIHSMLLYKFCSR